MARIRLPGLFLIGGLGWGASANSIPLAGNWQFRLDPDKVGRGERWYAAQLVRDTIFL